ncbi:hypothetical protein BDV41DRAFT_580688 [Aspergillus transmontanensis]|uniref:Uncharacterized protein n=1 Tax=Aspergillus transmontanensis TaxID=1034304 RepID=A0A5N6VL33_9EURO|nr:hypothetical protein BDV41DRAFT_580688 [Aspergillus transmontanensis]
MRATVGEKDFYTTSVAHKIAEHFSRMGRSEEAISMLNGALSIWSVDPIAHKNEIARSTFIKGKVLETTGKMQKASINLKVACRLSNEIAEEDRDVKSLATKDFDGIVAFWTRVDWVYFILSTDSMQLIIPITSVIVNASLVARGLHL